MTSATIFHSFFLMKEIKVDCLLCSIFFYSVFIKKDNICFVFSVCSSKRFTDDPAQSLEAESLNDPSSIMLFEAFK